MGRDTIELDQRVIIALDVYQPSRRDEILAEIRDLIDDPAGRRAVKDLHAARRIHLADTTGGLRVLYRVDEQGRAVEIVDLFRPWSAAAGPSSGDTRPAQIG